MMAEKNCVMVCAGDFREDSIQLLPGDFLIAVDNGLQGILKLGLTPDLILGDFDSLEEGAMAGCADLEALRRLSPEVLRLPVEKDDTDSMAAAREGLRRGYRHFILDGAAGGERLDHTLANLQTLLFLKRNGAKAQIRDGGMRIEILENEERHFPAGTRGGFSVFALEEKECRITIRGMHYEAENLVIRNDFPIGVSNSFLPEKEAFFSAQGSPALVIVRYEE